MNFLANKVEKIYNIIENKGGENTVILKIKEVSSLTDYFIITSADNERKVKAIAEEIEYVMANEGIEVNGKDGYSTSRWILLDYGDCIVHIFLNEERGFYDLERLWKDAPYVNLNK